MRITAKLLLTVLMGLGLNAMAQDLEHGGYVFGQYQMNNGALENTGGAAEENTFSSGGAFMLSKKMDGGEFHLDLPVAQSATSGTYTLANTLAQAYVRHSYDFGLSWTLGQFDQFIGAEANDANERFFMNASIHKNALVTANGATHTGAHFEYAMGAIRAGFLLANSDGDGSQASNKNQEMGINVGWENDSWNVGFGYLTTERTDAAPNNESQTIMDLIVGWNMGPWAAEFEYSTIANLGGTKIDDDVTGMMLGVTYDLNDDSGVGFRYTNITAATANFFGLSSVGAMNKDSAQTQITLGYNHKLTKELTAKLELSSNTLDIDGTNSDDWMEGALSAIYSF